MVQEINAFIKELKEILKEEIIRELKVEEMAKSIDKNERSLTGKEVCEIFRKSESSLRRYRGQGLDFIQAKKGCNITYRLSDCEKFFNSKRK